MESTLWHSLGDKIPLVIFGLVTVYTP